MLPCLQADTGTKMVHVGRNTRSRIVSKGIAAGQSLNAYRGLVQVGGARAFSSGVVRGGMVGWVWLLLGAGWVEAQCGRAGR